MALEVVTDGLAVVPRVACLAGGANEARRFAVVGGAGARAAVGAAIEALGPAVAELTVFLTAEVAVDDGLDVAVDEAVALDAVGAALVVPGPNVPELIT